MRMLCSLENLSVGDKTLRADATTPISLLNSEFLTQKSYIFSQITALLGWSVAAVLGMLLVYGPHKSVLPEAEEWNQAENVLYGTFHRFLWGLVLAWVTYACHYGAGGLSLFFP